MPFYVHKCTDAKCGAITEDFRPMRLSDARVVCNVCGARTRRVFSAPSRFGMDYQHAALDDSAGVAASQVAEHRRRFPDVPLTNDGRVIVKNATERRRLVRRLNKILGED